MRYTLSIVLCFLTLNIYANQLSDYNVVWKNQSKNSSESMPCGGGDIGLNVWVEDGELLFYMSRSGTFDENNAFLKLGRVRVKLTPNPFENSTSFTQELILNEGYIKIGGENSELSANIKLWVDVFNPVIHLEVKSSIPTEMEVCYESWRYQDRRMLGKSNNANSYKWAPQGEVYTYKDSILPRNNSILFFHRNRNDVVSVFDITVKQQGLDSLKEKMFNPIKNLTFGGIVQGKNFKYTESYTGKYVDTDFKGYKLQSNTPAKQHDINVFLHIAQTETLNEWEKGLQDIISNTEKNKKTTQKNTLAWWKKYWQRSFIYSSENNPASERWQTARNYTLFRYQLACNAYGKYPTKFNGGLFTYDPYFVDTAQMFTPDHRNWGGGTMTAQNQRLVYFPMFRSGDFDMINPQLDFYTRMLKNAELRSQVYWGHNGACFTEQIENFGLPNPSEYGWKRPTWYDKGMEYNAWLEYQWDTALEFCLMALDLERYNNQDITKYIPLITSSLTFFNEHYQYLAKLRGRRIFDENKHIIFYPGSACETYKMAYNAVSTTTALQVVTNRLLELPEKYLTSEQRAYFEEFSKRIPPITFREVNGKKTIAPAKLWERINNVEVPQLYPVFPWGVYGVGQPDLDIARNTYLYDPDALKFRSHVGWKQDNIFAARLGLADEAEKYTILKLKDADRRFPTFWGPGFDWTPDHNWGGSGIIGLQEMLLQTDSEKIYLFPAWKKDWDIHFKLHAPYNTTVEAMVKNGEVKIIKVVPEFRMKDIVNMLGQN